jgi:hypothetical protein
MRTTKNIKIAVAVSTVVCFLLYNGLGVTKDQLFSKPAPVTLKTKHIVFWTNFYDIPLWDMKKETYDESDLKSVDCPVTNCIITNKKDYLPNAEDYDALIFHVGASTHWTSSILPKTRNPNQFYIMASKE